MVVSIQLYGCTTSTLIKHIEQTLDGNCTRMLPAILNKSWKEVSTKQLLYTNLFLISKTTRLSRTRLVGHYKRSKGEFISDVLRWNHSYGRTGVGRTTRTYLQKLWADAGCCLEDRPATMADRDEWRERKSGGFVLMAGLDDDDDDDDMKNYHFSEEVDQ